MRCPKCKKIIPNGSRFCGLCATNISQTESSREKATDGKGRLLQGIIAGIKELIFSILILTLILGLYFGWLIKKNAVDISQYFVKERVWLESPVTLDGVEFIFEKKLSGSKVEVVPGFSSVAAKEDGKILCGFSGTVENLSSKPVDIYKLKSTIYCENETGQTDKTIHPDIDFYTNMGLLTGDTVSILQPGQSANIYVLGSFENGYYPVKLTITEFGKYHEYGLPKSLIVENGYE